MNNNLLTDPPSDAFEDKLLEQLDPDLVYFDEVRDACRIAHAHVGGDPGEESYLYAFWVVGQAGIKINWGMHDRAKYIYPGI